MAHLHPGILVSNVQERTIDKHNLDPSPGNMMSTQKPTAENPYSMIPFTLHFCNDKILEMENILVVARG